MSIRFDRDRPGTLLMWQPAQRSRTILVPRLASPSSAFMELEPRKSTAMAKTVAGRLARLIIWRPPSADADSGLWLNLANRRCVSALSIDPSELKDVSATWSLPVLALSGYVISKV